MPRRIARLALPATVVALVLAACGTPVGLRTAPAKVQACEDALIAGELVPSAASGLAVQGADGVTEVLWPFGYSATRETTGLVLRDETGRILVREHERIQMGGGLGANNVWAACAGSITEVSSVGG